MKVTPKTEKEIYEMNLLPDGWYPFTIASAENKVSKKNNEMILIKVKVYRGEGFSFVDDYLMDNDFSARKLRHLAETCGILDKYEAGGFDPDDLVNREGYARIGVEKSKDPQFSDKNKIWDFSATIPEVKPGSDSRPSKPTNSSSPAAGAGLDDDDIPFAPINPILLGIA